MQNFWWHPRCAHALLILLLDSAAMGDAPFRTGDLIFVRPIFNMSGSNRQFERAILSSGVATIRWLQAQGVPIPPENAEDIATHVAVAMLTDEGLHFIEAVPKFGVKMTPLRDFRSHNKGASFYRASAVGSAEPYGAQAADVARKQLGAPYANLFEQPSEGVFYCSSLVDYAFRVASGRPILVPWDFHMLFEPEDFWKRYYAERNQTVPIGKLGSNPTLLLHSPAVTYTHVNDSFFDIVPTATAEAAVEATSVFERCEYLELSIFPIVLFSLVLYRRRASTAVAEPLMMGESIAEDGRKPAS
eukprot:gnl/TRDRNA2_/TRDRNA2_202187_c0_seq1.p1 gnl/TRDRNA2_/TRDRNA2_202187_c0~~gnl/TRDRNA2_/TRDRNA2_202187_c0_seq1.p1  ORF type:complete len:302 (+),score=39.77 gnl/TRDRNA2_/TRDRNA2_202187_c0_seq1:22-927(+)